MIINEKASIREITPQDKTQLANLIHFGTYVHRHLDWRPPLNWIGHPPFYGIESQEKLLAALSCAPDPTGIAWIRLFVISSHLSQSNAWRQLWAPTKETLSQHKVSTVAAIPLQKWIRNLLEENNFEHVNNVISLASDDVDIAKLPKPKPTYIRTMEIEDLAEVADLDKEAFEPLWSNSGSLLSLALEQSIYATVSYDEKGITGYQISTPTQYGSHLGRLAVHPRAQGQGIGYALLHDLQKHFRNEVGFRLSVNTQDDNNKSIGLYKKAGFLPTAEIFPVYKHIF